MNCCCNMWCGLVWCDVVEHRSSKVISRGSGGYTHTHTHAHAHTHTHTHTRKGELTILTGPTGVGTLTYTMDIIIIIVVVVAVVVVVVVVIVVVVVASSDVIIAGKTTFLSQLSLDYALNGNQLCYFFNLCFLLPSIELSLPPTPISLPPTPFLTACHPILTAFTPAIALNSLLKTIPTTCYCIFSLPAIANSLPNIAYASDVQTLWGSFEIKNERLTQTLLHQVLEWRMRTTRLD